MSANQNLRGVFRAVILAVLLTKTRKGDGEVRIPFRTLGRYDALGQVEACSPVQRVIRMTVPNDRGMYRLQADFEAMGIQVDDFRRLLPGHPDPIHLEGREINVEFSSDILNGAEIERITVCRSTPMTAQDVEGFQSQFSHMLAPPKKDDANTRATASSAVKEGGAVPVPGAATSAA